MLWQWLEHRKDYPSFVIPLFGPKCTQLLSISIDNQTQNTRFKIRPIGQRTTSSTNRIMGMILTRLSMEDALPPRTKHSRVCNPNPKALLLGMHLRSRSRYVNCVSRATRLHRQPSLFCILILKVTIQCVDVDIICRRSNELQLPCWNKIVQDLRSALHYSTIHVVLVIVRTLLYVFKEMLAQPGI